MGLTYFFDSYALIEVAKGNPSYARFKTGTRILTTKMNLMELHYCVLRLQGKAEADAAYDLFLPFCVEVDDEIIKKANFFRLAHAKKDLSYVDCIGYVIACTLRIPFLTGDKQFKMMENVEHVI